MSPRDVFLSVVGNQLIHYSTSYYKFLEQVSPESELDVIEVRRDGQLRGMLPVAIRTHRDFGTVINSLPFFGSHGGPVTYTGDNETRLSLLQSFRDLLVERDVMSATLIEDPFNPLGNALVAASGLSVVDDRVSQFTRLPAADSDIESELFARFHVKTRNAVRKGLRCGQVVEQRVDDAAWTWMQTVHERSISALGGVPKPKRVFDALRRAFGDDARLYVGAVGTKPVSGLVVVRYRGTIEYFTPVVDEQYRDSQALSATIYTVMKALTEEGASLWNWGGTWRSQEGVYRFKSRWGAEDRPYRYLNVVRNENFREYPRATLARVFENFYLFRY